AMWALLFTFIGMFLFSLVWSANYWPPAPASMTGAPNLEALQLGFANAETLQETFGVPAIFFGLVQAAVLFAIYRAILKRERSDAVSAATAERADTPAEGSATSDLAGAEMPAE
ncbi:MAG: hypothetical protein ACR2PO_00770, partial [Methyloligellaceae bacterium]